MSSIIGPDLDIKGDINIKGDLLIYGQVDGNINCEGLITTMKGSTVKGSIDTIFADISGNIKGDLKVQKKVSLSSSASLNGDLLASIIVIEEGAQFSGLCKMSSETDTSSSLPSKKVANLNEGTKN
jgi:cytoskeletal protein CcmA (bactofilin family)